MSLELETERQYKEVYKTCNINAEGCVKRYNMELRVKSGVQKRYDACDNKDCQGDYKPPAVDKVRRRVARRKRHGK